MASPDPEFTLFPKLPAEVRAMIWTMSFMSRSGRIVEVRNHEAQHRPAPGLDSGGNVRLQLWSPSPPPQIANVNHEARDVAERVAMKAGHFPFQRIFFDPAIDTLYIPRIERPSTLGQAIRLDHVCFYARDMEAFTYGLMGDLRRLTEVKTITVVAPSHPARLLPHRMTDLQYVRRMVSCLAAQEAFNVRRAGNVPYICRFPKVEVFRLAIRIGGKFSQVKPIFRI